MGMVVAIVTGLIKRALNSQMAAQQAQAQSQPRPQSSPQPAAAKRVDPTAPRAYKTWTVTDTIYQGMNKDELVAAYGQPQTRETSSPTTEIWTYSANDNGMEVVIESGLVADWTEAAVSLH